ncbi:hypothetical protein ACC702_03800 [Rhizobium ruizarguesonis]|jgi:hypothetical protein|uniref:hypothetical protein n=1 Tax=Rhizobium leguminosarum TaxID=384 RepID=UPI0010320BBA|nr:hypothetical protein [Rhizobium leguminosarum]MBY5485179.1 hypothetical protein [Rhizobium leguminosarum]TAY88116.1 hypothetical protein ELH83_09950 [Rhizobium leguminosarum]TBZ31258.1 hypothetical protein E0H36_18635 [Rhizobium leguminosarum bv. viciae]
MRDPFDNLFPWIGPSELGGDFDTCGDDDDLAGYDLLQKSTSAPRCSIRSGLRMPGMPSTRLSARDL